MERVVLLYVVSILVHCDKGYVKGGKLYVFLQGIVCHRRTCVCVFQSSLCIVWSLGVVQGCQGQAFVCVCVCVCV